MALTTLLIALVLQTPEPVKLMRTYTSKSVSTYEVKINVPGADLEITGDVIFTGLDDKGKFSVRSKDLKTSLGGTAESIELLQEIQLNTNGLAKEYEFSEQGIPIILTTVAAFTPNSSLKVDEPFAMENKEGTYYFKGTGKLTKIEDREGKKIGYVSLEIEMGPKEEATPGRLALKSQFNLASGNLEKSEGTLIIEGVEGKISITRK